MCIAVSCSTCGGVTWAGCGDHVEQVLVTFPDRSGHVRELVHPDESSHDPVRRKEHVERRYDDVATSRLTRRRRLQRVAATVLLAALAAVSAVTLADSQRHDRNDLYARWNARTELASGFVTTYVEQLFQREA